MGLISKIRKFQPFNSVVANPRQRSAGRAPFRCVFAAAFAISALNSLPRAVSASVFDDFSDLNDTANPTWVHLDGAVGSTGQTWDASTGQYRLHDPTVATGGGQIAEFGGILTGFGFVGSYVPTSFTDVRVTADIVDFIPPDFQSSYVGFALAARFNGDNGPPTEARGGALRGYSYQYEPTANSGLGEMVLTIISGDFFKDVGSFKVTLDNSKDYRVVFEVVGNTLHGQVMELEANGAVGAIVADQFRDLDANPPNPDTYDGPANPERPFEPYTSGYTGVYGVGYVLLNHDADFTIDNYRAESLALPGDFDGDGDVDGADLAQWKGDFSLVGGSAGSDADGDGDSDGADFLAWQQNLGSPAPVSAPNTVPEPTSMALIAAAAALLARRRSQCPSIML